jgi:hypothetical protein
MLRGLVMDGHNSLRLTSLSLLYRFANVLHIWTLYLLLNTFCPEWNDVVPPRNELLNIFSFDLFTVSKNFLMQPNIIIQFLTFFPSGVYFYSWTRFYTNVHAE